MLQDIRKHAQGRAAKIIVGGIAVVLGCFGLESVFMHFTGLGADKDTALVRVNGEVIARAAVDSQLRAMAAQGQIPEGGEAEARRALRSRLIDSTLLRQYLTKGGFTVSRDETIQYLMQAHGLNSAADVEQALKQAAAQNRVSVDSILAQYRQMLQLELMDGAIAASTWTTPAERQRLAALQQETRTFRYRLLSAHDLAQPVHVSNEEMLQYYEAHKADFVRPEQVRFDYILLDRDAMGSSRPVSEEALHTAYERKVATAKRLVSDIVINITPARDEAAARARMNDVQQRLAKGESFASLARRYSDDAASAARGGDLGAVEPGIYGGPFDSAVQSLQVGQHSAPVLMDGALHLLTVTGLDVGSFDSMKAALTRDVQRQQAGAPYEDAARRLADLVDESDDFEAVAKQLGVALQHSDWLAKRDHRAPFNNPKVMDEAFDPSVKNKGYNSQVIRLDDHRTMVLHVTAARDAAQLSFADVSDQVRARVEQQKIAQALSVLGQKSIEQLSQGSQGTEGGWTQVNAVMRGSVDVEPAVLAAAFTVARPTDAKPRYAFRMLPEGTRGVLIMLQKTDVRASDSEDGRIKAELERVRGSAISASVLEQLRREAHIEG